MSGPDFDVKVTLHNNPWEQTATDKKLFELLELVGASRASHVRRMHAREEWPRESLGLALMIPGAPSSMVEEDALLATIAIGPEGDRFVPNAIAKASYHHVYGKPAGYGVYMDLALSADGDFAYGFSTRVDDMIAAASAQKEIQDACEAAHAAATFLYFIRRERQAWFDAQQERPHWFSTDDSPHVIFTTTAARRSIYKPD